MSSFTSEEDHFMDAGGQSVSQQVLQVEQDKQVAGGSQVAGEEGAGARPV